MPDYGTLLIKQVYIMENTYTYVDWPESQNYMELPGFAEHSKLDYDSSGAYFIETEWLRAMDRKMAR